MDSQVMLLEDGSTLVLIHLMFLSPAGVIDAEGLPLGGIAHSRPTWKLACAPGLVELPAQMSRPWPYQRSDDPRAVTCPTCKKSKYFAAAKAALEAGTGRPM